MTRKHSKCKHARYAGTNCHSKAAKKARKRQSATEAMHAERKRKLLDAELAEYEDAIQGRYGG